MAVVWAKQNGNWTTTSIWAFWNEATQQIEDYGQVPQVDDVVYCNGYTIDARQGINIQVKEIHNGANPHTGLSNGIIYVNPTFNISAQCYHDGATSLFQTNSSGAHINGDVYKLSEATTFSTISNGSYSNLSINGNVVCPYNGGFLISANAGYSLNVTINGNCIMPQATISHNPNPTSSIVINGNCECLRPHPNGNNTVMTYCTGTLIVNGWSDAEFTCNIINYDKFNIILSRITPIDENLFRIIYTGDFNNNVYRIFTIYDLNNRQQYPAEDEVKEGTEYVWGELVGTYQQPPESVVLEGFVYDNGDKIGSLENQNIVGCVTPEDVRKDVPLVGMGVVGTLVVPSVDDVREGVHFDNDSVGTLIVQGGGDRLRIANFGYYTDAQSDTYIVDLTEQDKPKFAVAEERVLIEMFPELDFDNIPDKYFDDLFVKYLKYRLIVEYYRTAGINSTFTPSEPTTEIVNYRNVNCEIWMNIANTYLKAWGEKYPNSIKKQRILL